MQKRIKSFGFGMAMGLFLILGSIILPLTAAAQACDDPPPDDNLYVSGGAGDPTFMFPDNRPGQSVKNAQNALNNNNADDSTQTPSTLSRTEADLLDGFIRKIKEGPSTQAVETVMDAWRGDSSADLKKAVLMQGMAKTQSSEEVQLMQFMSAALDDLTTQRGKIAQLARGNGLEKQEAARLLVVLNQNPQTRIAD